MAKSATKRGRKRLLSQEDIDLIRSLYKLPGRTAPGLAKLFRCSAGTILRAVDGRAKARDE